MIDHVGEDMIEEARSKPSGLGGIDTPFAIFTGHPSLTVMAYNRHLGTGKEIESEGSFSSPIWL